MTAALYLLILMGMLGALDTVWYHEWTQRLPARPNGGRELMLHALRDYAFCMIFGSLAWFTWNGYLAVVFCGLLVFEIVITLVDFLEEDRVRPLPPGERIMHTVLAIVYGAFLANLLPQLADWWTEPTAMAPASYGVISLTLTAFAIGVLVSGCRDHLASRMATKPTDTAFAGER